MSEFIKLVEEMRRAQKSYFRTRRIEVLQLSKDLEGKVDRQIAEFKDSQNKLKF